MGDDWHLQNTAQAMQNDQEHNALIPDDVVPAADFVARLKNPLDTTQLRAPAGSTVQFLFTNQFDIAGNRLPFNTPNGLVSPGTEWHVRKPISATAHARSAAGSH